MSIRIFLVSVIEGVGMLTLPHLYHSGHHACCTNAMGPDNGRFTIYVSCDYLSVALISYFFHFSFR
jgi:hypothetical protein